MKRKSVEGRFAQALCLVMLGGTLMASPAFLEASQAASEAPASVEKAKPASTRADAVPGSDISRGEHAVGSPAEGFVQVPGIYRQQIGQLQVTALLDGTLWLPADVMKGLSVRKIRTMLREMHVPQRADGSQLAVNVFLVRRGERLMLVDSGAGRCLGEGVGKLLDNLRHAGIEPAQVTDVLLTHAHPDHVCGLVDGEGLRVFDQATLWLPVREGAYWLSERQKRRAPKEAQPYFDMAARSLLPYQTAGKLRQFTDQDSLPPGVTAIQTPGHTPGHVSWLIDGQTAEPAMSSGRQRAARGRDQLLVWGDVVHMHAVQFARPEAWLGFDVDPEQAIRSRRQMLARATKSGWWVAGSHLPFPGMGHVIPDRQAYRWLPSEFGPVSPHE